jgi:hypothetical protein
LGGVQPPIIERESFPVFRPADHPVSVKTIETHQMRMKEKLALHSAAELRQKAREWLAKSAVNRIREDPDSE